MENSGYIYGGTEGPNFKADNLYKITSEGCHEVLPKSNIGQYMRVCHF
jgi:hypothetical protein